MSPAPGHEALDVSWDFEWWNTGSFEARGFFSHLQAGWTKAEHRAYVGSLQLPGRSVLFDAGYAPRFHDCAAPRLASIYRWATPAMIPAGSSVRERLAGRKVDQLLLSHWHADHTGGLLDIPEASVWRPFSSHEAVRQEALSAWAPLKGILVGQFPDDLPGRPGEPFSARLRDVEAAPLMALPVDRWPFLAELDGRCRDVFGDGSLATVDLPGHALGHYGVLFQTQLAGRSTLVLLCGDAVWDERELTSGWQRGPAAFFGFRSLGQAAETTRMLRRLYQAAKACGMERDLHVLPTHCRLAASRFVASGGRD
jgi:glyoxylase-like metal-dependent hydrolase (beta-lactamase superfamily II)